MHAAIILYIIFSLFLSLGNLQLGPQYKPVCKWSNVNNVYLAYFLHLYPLTSLLEILLMDAYYIVLL